MQEVASGRELSVERLKEGLRRDFGAFIMNALNDKSVIEVMLNPDGRIWLDELGKGMRDSGEKMRPAQALRIFTTVASLLDTSVNEEHPILEGELPLDGSRFEGLIPPIVQAPCFAIRKKALLIYTLEDYVRQGVLTQRHFDAINFAIDRRKNILVIGGTSSGKTTLLNAVLDSVAQRARDHRVVVIEDTGEIQCSAENVVTMRSNSNISMQRLLRATMRLRPDRIVVGEVRGAEAADLLEAWNTGHPGGAATAHANSAIEGLARIERLIEKSGAIPHPPTIADAIDLVIFIEKEEGGKKGRKVREVAEVVGYDVEKRVYVLNQL